MQIFKPTFNGTLLKINILSICQRRTHTIIGKKTLFVYSGTFQNLLETGYEPARINNELINKIQKTIQLDKFLSLYIVMRERSVSLGCASVDAPRAMSISRSRMIIAKTGDVMRLRPLLLPPLPPPGPVRSLLLAVLCARAPQTPRRSSLRTACSGSLEFGISPAVFYANFPADF